jgi:hypothetical protein
LLLDVIVFGHGRDQGGSFGDLADAVEDDLGAAVIQLDRAVNLDGAAFEAADVAYIFQVARKDYDREGTRSLFATESDKVHAFGSNFHMDYASDDAFSFADVLAGCTDGEAVGGCGYGR